MNSRAKLGIGLTIAALLAAFVTRGCYSSGPDGSADSHPTTNGSISASSTGDAGASTGGPPKLSLSPDAVKPEQLPPRVQAFLDDTYKDRQQHALFTELATAKVDEIQRGSKSRQAAIEAFGRFSNAYECIVRSRGVDYSDPHRDVAKIQEIAKQVTAEEKALAMLIINDKQSMLDYLQFRENLSGQTYSRPRNPPCAG